MTASRRFSLFPIPHLVIDQVLPESALAAVHRSWPRDTLFSPEVQGNYLFHFSPLARLRLGSAQRRFWRAFQREVFDSLVRECLLQFGPWLAPWIAPLERLFWGHDYLSLMQSEAHYPGHGIHTHHYHDPTFLFTMLLYLGPERDGTPGTRLHGFAPPHPSAGELAWVAGNGLTQADARPWESVQIDYVPNRLVAFLDGPVAFHDVPAATSPASDLRLPPARRVLRAHLQAPHSPIVERRYGVSWQEYKTEFAHKPTSDRVLSWLERDIAEHHHPAVLAAHPRGHVPLEEVRLPQVFDDAHLWYKTPELGYRTRRTSWRERGCQLQRGLAGNLHPFSRSDAQRSPSS